MIYPIFIAVLLLVALLWLRRFLRISIPTTIVIAVVLSLLGYLTLTGRMNWLFTLLATVALAGMRLLRSPFAYILLGWLRKSFSRNHSGPAVFRTGHVVVRVDPFSGIIDGEVIKGAFAGSRLSGLSEEQIEQLLQECTPDDPRAVRILKIYQKYVCRFGFGGARESADADGSVAGNVDMSAPSLADACEILGVSIEDNWKTVSSARQRLLSRLHPDKGGSNWIAQRINSAWEVLKSKHPNSPK